MTEPGAVVHIVCPENRSCKLLYDIIVLVGALGRAEHPDSIGAMAVKNAS